jgi:hypothetical protein
MTQFETAKWREKPQDLSEQNDGIQKLGKIDIFLKHLWPDRRFTLLMIGTAEALIPYTYRPLNGRKRPTLHCFASSNPSTQLFQNGCPPKN